MRFSIGKFASQGRSSTPMMDYCDGVLLPKVEGAAVALADGMGSYEGGLQASRGAVDAALSFLVEQDEITPQTLQDAVFEARREVSFRQAQDERTRQMATTLVLAVVVRETLYVAHLGDSRATLFRPPYLKRMTQDHLSVISQLGLPNDVGIKSDPRYQALSNRVARCVGRGEDPADLASEEIRPGDRILLYSDGITEHVLEDELADLINAEPNQAAKTIVERAVKAGSDDHCSAAILSIDGAGSLTRTEPREPAGRER